MESLPGYDAWKTTPPDPVFTDTYCNGCGETFDAADEYVEGDECPECGYPDLEETEPDVPCTCTGDACYC